MTFDEVLAQVQDLLQREQRVSYRGLKRRFALDDEYLEDLKEELIGAQRLATDEDGRFLVWKGGDTEGEKTKSGNGEKAKASALGTSDSGLSLGERRQLTVQFIDLVGSTALSQQLDPEELRAIIQAYRETCAAAIARFGGYLAKYIGDGLLVYFGYPQAHEDDAQRAVLAGLDMVAALPQLNGRLQSTLAAHGCAPLQVRIGIHTGLVVAGEMGVGDRPEPLGIVGETPNIAARLQDKAAPNSVVLSLTTSQLVTGLFEYQDLGPQELKGLSTPLSVYRVVGKSAVQSRFEAAVQKGLTPLVGRAEELASLRRRWQQAKEREGQIVLLSGESGIGKSRLVQELKEQLAQEGATCIEFRCSPHHQGSALYPIIDHLQRLLQFARDDTPAAKLEKLQHLLSHYHFPQADTLPLLAALLSLPHPEGYPPLAFSPQKQKQNTHDVLVAWLVSEAEKTPVYFVWEDVHWADPSSVEVLTQLMAEAPTTRLLLLATSRPEFIPPWGVCSYLSQMTLSRLDRMAVESMVEQVTRGKSLPTDLLRQIVRKTDGVPLFVEELTKSVVESVEAQHAVPLQLAIPATLQDALMARLDRLATAKEVAQLAAVLGREFSYELLQAISPFAEGSLQQGLRQLVETELVYQRGMPPQATYTFKHALIQDTAYQSLLKSRRQQLHQQIAQVLAERFPATQETQPELLAHHYTEAGLIAQAIPQWQRAGQRAAQRSANAEAIAHLTKGLELLQNLPDTVERAQQELTLRLALGPQLVASKGYAAPEVERFALRMQELCRQVGETPQLFPAVWGLRAFYTVRGELATAYKLGVQLLNIAQNVREPAFLLEAHLGLGIICGWRGELARARAHLEQAVSLYDPQQHSSLAFRYGYNPGALSHGFTALVLWMLGYPDQALRQIEEALVLAQESSHPFSHCYVLMQAVVIHMRRREVDIAQERVEVAFTLANERGFAHFLAGGNLCRGWVLAEQGQYENGILLIRQGIVALQATGAGVEIPGALCFLAQADAEAGQPEEGLQVLSEALTVLNKNGDHVEEAEWHQLKGELTLQSQVESHKSKVEEAEACFLKAIEISQKHQTKSWELRATMSLARLWQQQGKRHEAREKLAAIYNWFTEGFDTKDLQEAKRLIEELS